MNPRTSAESSLAVSEARISKQIKISRHFKQDFLLAYDFALVTLNPVPSRTLTKSKLPAGEVAVAERLRMERSAERFTQAELADEIGLTRTVLGNYEYGLARLPFAAGWAFCRRLDLNPRWLATGQEPQRPFVPLAELQVTETDLRPALAPRVAFVDGYERFLRPAVERWLKANPPEKRIARAMEGGPAAAARRQSSEQLETHLLEFVAAFKSASNAAQKIGYLAIVEAYTSEIRNRLETKFPHFKGIK